MDWPAYVREVTRLRAAYDGRIDILLGVELDCLYDPASCPGAEYVIGSTHFLDVDSPEPLSVDCSEDDLRRLCREHFAGDWLALCRAYYDLEAQVHERTGCTFAGHFDLVTRFNDAMGFVDEKSDAYLAPALEAMEYLARDRGVPFEINCGAYNRGRKRELYPRLELLRALHDFGGEIFISSDAHQVGCLNGSFDVAVERARACGFTHVNVLAHDVAGNVEIRQLALDVL
jgi:histidinol-phosphatase (PHP family)